MTTDPKLKCDLCGNPRSWHEGKNTVRRGVHAFVMPSDDKSARMLADMEARAGVRAADMSITTAKAAGPAQPGAVFAPISKSMEKRLAAVGAPLPALGGPTDLDQARTTAFAIMNHVLALSVGGQAQPITDLEPVDEAILAQVTEAVYLYGSLRATKAIIEASTSNPTARELDEMTLRNGALLERIRAYETAVKDMMSDPSYVSLTNAGWEMLKLLASEDQD